MRGMKWQKEWTSCFLLLLPIISLETTESCLEGAQKGPSGAAPKLLLQIDQPRRPDLSTSFHKLEENVVLINKTGLLQLRLDCWAPYPIDLKFSGHLTNQETSVKTFRKDLGENGTTTCFFINATMESYEEITGNYTCLSVQNKLLSSSYYIFVSPTPPGVLLTRGQRITLQPKLWDRFVIFPCAVSRPLPADDAVQLIKEDFGPLQLSKDLTFDPKVGFKMAFESGYDDDDSRFGNYFCRTGLSPNDQVNLTLLPPKKFQVSPTSTYIRLSPHDHLNISCEASEDFFISTVPENLTASRNEVTFVPQAPYLKHIGLFHSSSLEPGMSGYVSCKWKGNGKIFAQWAFSVQKEPIRPGHFDAARVVSACPNATDVVIYECSNLIECRINSCLRKDSRCHSNANLCSTEKDRTCIRSGLVQCPSRGSSALEIFFTGFANGTSKPNRYVDWRHARKEELLLLHLSKETFIPKKGEGSRNLLHFQFSCQGPNLVFSSGFRWYFKHRNGSRLRLHDTSESHHLSLTIQNTLRERRSNLESLLSLTFPANEEDTVAFISNVIGVECEAPIWDSFEWMSTHFEMDMSTSAAARSFRDHHESEFTKETSAGSEATSFAGDDAMCKLIRSFILILLIM